MCARRLNLGAMHDGNPIDGEERDDDDDDDGDVEPIAYDVWIDEGRFYDVEREDFLGIDGSGPDGE